MTLNTFLMTDGISNEEIELDEFKQVYSKQVFNHEIDDALCYLTRLSMDELRTRSRAPELVEIRQVGMYFYILNGNSLSLSGKVFGRDHATALHSKKRIENYYNVKWERHLTDFVNRVSMLTRISLPDSLINKI